MNANTHASPNRRSRAWLHAKRAPIPAPAPLDANPVSDAARNHVIYDLEAGPISYIPGEGSLDGEDLSGQLVGPGPVSLSPSATLSDGTPAQTASASTADSTATSTSDSTSASPTPSPSVPASSSPAPSSSGQASATLSTKHGVPGVAIGLVSAVLVLAAMAALVVFLRRKALRARARQRETWNSRIFIKTAGAAAPGVIEQQFAEKVAVPPVALPAYAALAAPPLSYDSVAPPTPASATAPRARSISGASSHSRRSTASASTTRSLTHPAPALPALPASASPFADPAAAPPARTALIRCVFVPCLPDELSISTGERVRVLAAYDDGWAMCVDARGAQGMVPAECLDLGAERASGEWRASRRVSSLPGARY